MVQLVEVHKVRGHNLEQVSRTAGGAGCHNSLASREGRRRPERVVEGIQVEARCHRARPENMK